MRLLKLIMKLFFTEPLGKTKADCKKCCLLLTFVTLPQMAVTDAGYGIDDNLGE